MTWMGEALSHCCHTDAMPQLRAGFATPTGQEAETAKLWKGHSQRRLSGEGSQRHGCARSSPGGASASGWPLVRRLIRAPQQRPTSRAAVVHTEDPQLWEREGPAAPVCAGHRNNTYIYSGGESFDISVCRHRTQATAPTT